MLTISRREGQQIVIGENIVVTIVFIDRNQIRIGIDAPRDVAIYRDELLMKGNERAMEFIKERADAARRKTDSEGKQSDFGEERT